MNARPGLDTLGEINAEAGDYIEDDPEAWLSWLDALRRYGPDLAELVKRFGDGGYEIAGGAILSYLADQHGLIITRLDPSTEASGPSGPPMALELASGEGR